MELITPTNHSVAFEDCDSTWARISNLRKRHWNLQCRLILEPKSQSRCCVWFVLYSTYNQMALPLKSVLYTSPFIKGLQISIVWWSPHPPWLYSMTSSSTLSFIQSNLAISPSCFFLPIYAGLSLLQRLYTYLLFLKCFSPIYPRCSLSHLLVQMPLSPWGLP